MTRGLLLTSLWQREVRRDFKVKRFMFVLLAAVIIFAGTAIFQALAHALSHENIDDKRTNMQFVEIVFTDVYNYRPAGRRDPFAPLVVKPKPVREPRPLKPGVPVESYDISEFILIATLWNKAGHYAVIRLPDGKSYTIREGMKLGLHGGKVYKITKDSVIIRENIKDHRGTFVPRDKILKLRLEDEG